MGRRTIQSSARARRSLPRVFETSAGGVVVRKFEGTWHVALLKTRHRRGEVWVLPKGHIERSRGETSDVAAAREVKEELGISKVRVIRKLGTISWVFKGERDRASRTVLRPGQNGKPANREESVLVQKTVHHYLMEGLSERLRPQKDEGFLEARWVPLRDAIRLLSYQTDQSVLLKVGRTKHSPKRG